MTDKQTDRTPKSGPKKSFMTAGPTLHYSHANVQRCWLMSLVVFCFCCLFWSKVVTGSLWAFDYHVLINPGNWYLDELTTGGVGIFEYPWQIFVLGLLMGTLAAAPVLVSQLMSFLWSLAFIAAVVLLGNLPGLAVSLLISCAAVACRPLRFRSRFISIVLCITPQVIYWGFFGVAKSVEPVRWGFSFTPWICAWLVGLAQAGVVLGIGHYTRYRPGLILVSTSIIFLSSVWVFQDKIGFDELDYQLYVAGNNPEVISEFHDHSITEALDSTIANPNVREYLAGFFYPIDPAALRAELKKEIQIELSYDRWPRWFIVPEELKYQIKRRQLFENYERFISKRPQSRRMPVALYYKALLSDFSPDIKLVGQKEVLHFYSDYPYERSREVWYRLYSQFGKSIESTEARWRIAKDWAGQGRFKQAQKLIEEASAMVYERLEETENKQTPESFYGLFRPPAASAMTRFRLAGLQMRLRQLYSLISEENRTKDTGSAERLARFVMLNPHIEEYSWYLEELLAEIDEKDPLRDNVLLAQARLIADGETRAEKLSELHKKFGDTDGGTRALYELALLKTSLWREQDESETERKKTLLADAHDVLSKFVSLYPESIYTAQARKNLEDLPAVE